MEKIDVLDHGYVRLVDSMGNDLSVVRSARVSYDAAWRAGEDEGSDTRLINYLARNHHTTPFESVEFQFEVQAPIMVFRQWHRHRTWSYNEVSARYTVLPDLWYTPAVEQITEQSKNNKQQRTDQQIENAETCRRIMAQSCKDSYRDYEKLLSLGSPRELARGVLPFFMYSRMFAKVDLHNLGKFIQLRDHAHAQYEVQVYARAMAELARPVAPVAVEALLCHK